MDTPFTESLGVSRKGGYYKGGYYKGDVFLTRRETLILVWCTVTTEAMFITTELTEFTEKSQVRKISTNSLPRRSYTEGIT